MSSSIVANDRVDWHPRLAEEGYPSLAIDFCGRGESDGDFENDPVILDAQAAMNFLHQRWYSRYICLGAGLGGTTCMVIALTKPPEGLIVLSGTLSVGPHNELKEEDLTCLSMPKLFAYRERDALGFPEAMQTIYRRAQEPKMLHTCKSAGHG